MVYIGLAVFPFLISFLGNFLTMFVGTSIEENLMTKKAPVTSKSISLNKLLSMSNMWI